MKTRENGKDEVTIISSGVVLEGKLSSNGDVRIDGSVNGDIQAKGNVTVGEHGDVNGEINAENITVGGKASGSVIAKEKLTLESKAVLKGDLTTKILVVEAGAKFEGNSRMGSTEPVLRPSGVNPAPKNA
jgi:cytoskeletal protein CcmA (bactofilin family)